MKPTTADPVLIRQSRAARRYDMTVQALTLRRRTDPAFPEPIRLNPRAVYYRLADLDAYFCASKEAAHV